MENAANTEQVGELEKISPARGGADLKLYSEYRLLG